MIPKIIFISSTGTELGKTYILENLIKLLLQKQKKVFACKPIISGFDAKDIKASDSGIILNALKKEVSIENIKSISPWIYKAPMAPTIAAKKEGKVLVYKELKGWVKDIIKRNKKKFDYILIEGAGGLMVPIGNKKTFLDLVDDLKIPVILVVGSYLGSISHTLSIIKNLENKRIKTVNIIINEGINSSISLAQTFTILKDNMTKKVSIRKVFRNRLYFNKILTDINGFS